MKKGKQKISKQKEKQSKWPKAEIYCVVKKQKQRLMWQPPPTHKLTKKLPAKLILQIHAYAATATKNRKLENSANLPNGKEEKNWKNWKNWKISGS